MTKDEVLKLALEAFKSFYEDGYCRNECFDHITAIKEALAQTEQDGKCKYCTDGCPACDARKLPPQRTWVWLTLDERIELAKDVDWAIGAYCEYAEKIEAKLKEKNT